MTTGGDDSVNGGNTVETIWDDMSNDDRCFMRSEAMQLVRPLGRNYTVNLMTTLSDHARDRVSRGSIRIGQMECTDLSMRTVSDKPSSSSSNTLPDGLWMFDESSPLFNQLLDPLTTSGADIIRISKWCGHPECTSHLHYRLNPSQSTVYPYYTAKTNRCGHCNAIYYCNPECQQRHRAVHKLACNVLWKYDRVATEDCAMQRIKSYWRSFGGGLRQMESVLMLASHLAYAEKERNILSHSSLWSVNVTMFFYQM